MPKVIENPYARRPNAYPERNGGGRNGAKVLFAWLTILIGAAMFVWVFYNRFIERQPEYSDNSSSPRGPLSVGLVMMVVGSRWLRRA